MMLRLASWLCAVAAERMHRMGEEVFLRLRGFLTRCALHPPRRTGGRLLCVRHLLKLLRLGRFMRGHRLIGTAEVRGWIGLPDQAGEFGQGIAFVLACE